MKGWENIHKEEVKNEEFLDDTRKKIKIIKIIDEMSDKELGFAVRNNLIKWQEIRAWQERFGYK